MTFTPEWNPGLSPKPEDYIIVFDKSLALFDLEAVSFVTYRFYLEIINNSSYLPAFYIGTFAHRRLFLIQNEIPGLPEGYGVEIRSIISLMPAQMMEAVSSAKMTHHWLTMHRFCGQCREELQPDGKERSLGCRSCGAVYYPKISPAVITAVLDGESILLGHNKRFPEGLYSLIAGFVDPGESAENAVIREVMEETGIQVKDITYIGSQPWPFPDSLMLGFTAEYSGGDIICDDEEITDARWFTKDNLPSIPGRGSIARRIMEEVFPHLKDS